MIHVRDKREFHRVLLNNGYKCVRNHGDHKIYSNGTRTISINISKPNRMVMNRLVRDYNLVV